MARWHGRDLAKGNILPLCQEALKGLGCRARRSEEKGEWPRQLPIHLFYRKTTPNQATGLKGQDNWISLRSLGALWVKRRAGHYLAILALRSGFLRRAHPEPLSQYLSSCACLLSWLWPPLSTHTSTL